MSQVTARRCSPTPWHGSGWLWRPNPCHCRSDAPLGSRHGRIVCERVYFDTATILRQLGIAHDPLKLTGRVATVLNHPLTIGRAVVRQVTGR